MNTKLSRLTRTISTSVRRRKSRFQFPGGSDSPKASAEDQNAFFSMRNRPLNSLSSLSE